MTRRRKALLAAVVLGGIFLAFLGWKPPLLADVSFSRAVFDRNGALLRLTLSQDEKYRLFVPLKDISASLREAVLLQEDRYFYSHAGVNPVSLLRAFGHTYLGGGRKMGASTITMQLARIKYGIHSRHLTGKLWQMLRALQLEMHYSKDELLEAYLNLAPYGDNIEGVGAASFIYFHQKPNMLTLPEAVSLAIIPQSPAKRRPDKHNPASAALIEARNRLFKRWLEAHPQDASQKLFFALPLATSAINDLPFEAPHLTQHLLGAYPELKQITASIDLDMQQLLEGILRNYVADRRQIGINNASALLVDSKTMQVIASIGSADFADRTISGQVDGTRAKRSPGSALKPFIYALAFDQGLIHPLSILSDSPAAFGSYSPDNFDKDFRGPISARDALRLSRNIPAIRLAKQLHGPSFYEFLVKAGISKLRKEKDYGLSLVLGGAEVTARELATLYAMLANNGVERPLVFQLTRPRAAESTALLSPEASFMTLDVLRDTPRPSMTGENAGVYWKTGTSNGYHDAWTAGVFGHYVLVVWVGNFNGQNNPALVGVRSAAPLFFAMIDAINHKEPQREVIEAKAASLHIQKVNVCATSGDLTAEGCPVMSATWFIPGVSPIQNHNIYRNILVSARSGKRACRVEEGVTEYRNYEVWPSDLQQTLRKAGILKPPLPSWEEGCSGEVAAGEGQKPMIISPQATVEYHARLNVDATEAIAFSASADGAARMLHWFVDNEYIGHSLPGETLQWHPRPGAYEVRVVDDAGRSAMTTMRVSLAP